MNDRWQTCQWADGPKLAEWIDQQRVMPNGTTRRRLPVEQTVDRWRKGGLVSVWAIDKWLAPRGVHLSELPDELWVVNRRRADQADPDVVAAALELLGKEPLKVIARRFGVAPSTVRYWRNKRVTG